MLINYLWVKALATFKENSIINWFCINLQIWYLSLLFLIKVFFLSWKHSKNTTVYSPAASVIRSNILHWWKFCNSLVTAHIKQMSHEEMPSMVMSTRYLKHFIGKAYLTPSTERSEEWYPKIARDLYLCQVTPTNQFQQLQVNQQCIQLLQITL